MWASAAVAQRSINYGLGSEMGMVGLRDLFVVAPAFNPNHHQHDANLISDPHSLAGGNPATALGVGVGVGVIPLLTAGPCLGVDEDNLLTSRSSNRGGGGIHLWQQNQQSAQHYLKKTPLGSFDHQLHNASAANHDLIGGGIGVGGGLASSSGATATCQDCGNQAKKDCSHRRCRTCCRSRGFDCSTHVKSTWVPAARRRERQLMAVTPNAAAAGSSGSTSGAKKPRLITSQTTSHTSTSNTTPPRSLDTSSSHQDAGFKETLPSQVRAPAVFKCVRVTAVEDGDDEFAYQAVVKIGGHVFKGFLYDQGIEAGDGFPNVSELHLGDGGGNGGGRLNRNGGSSAPLVDPSNVYNAAASGGAGQVPGFLCGSNYGNQMS